jgi:hypothetical protein
LVHGTMLCSNSTSASAVASYWILHVGMSANSLLDER